jgi:hypothetical protein
MKSAKEVCRIQLAECLPLTPPVWEFTVEAHDEQMIHTFVAWTDITWLEFCEQAYERFNTRREDVQLGYRVGSGKLTKLTEEAHWETALKSLRVKMPSARSLQVKIELKNMVSDRFSQRRRRKYLLSLQCMLRLVSDWSCSASLTRGLPSRLFPLVSRTFPTLDVLCHVSVMCCVMCYVALFYDVP